MPSRKEATKRRRTEYDDYSAKQERGFTPKAFKPPKGVNLYQPKSGPHRIDIIPFVAGKGNPCADENYLHWERTYYVHKGIGPDNDTVVCLKRTFGKACPVCEHRTKLADDPENASELVEKLVPKKRQLFLVIDHAEKDKGVQVWDMSYHLFGKLLEEKIQNADDEDKSKFKKFWLPENGMTLRISVVDDTFGGRSFIRVSDIEFKDRKNQYAKDYGEEQACLDELLTPLSYKELSKLFMQAAEDADDEDEDDDDEDEDESPKSARGAKKSTKAGRKTADDDDEDDSDDDDEDDEDDEDEDENPRRGSKSSSRGTKKRSSKDDDEEDEEDDEEDDEDDLDEEEDDDDEDSDSSEPEFSKGDEISFKYKGKTLQGTISRVDTDNEIYSVKVPGKSNVSAVAFDDKTIKAVESDEDDDDEEEDEDEDVEIKPGDICSIKVKGKTVKGKVNMVNKKKDSAVLHPSGGGKGINVKLSSLTLVESADEDDDDEDEDDED